MSPLIHKKAADERHEYVADNVPAGRTQKLAGASGEACEHRKARQSQEYVCQYAQCAQFHSENGCHEINCQHSQGDGNGADGDIQG